MQPTKGRTVLYKLSQYDADGINQRRQDAGAFNRSLEIKPEPGERGRSGHVLHTGNQVEEGDVFPSVVVADSASSVNLHVQLDGNDTYWATSRSEGGEPGQWAWPAITAATPAPPQLGGLVHYTAHGTPVRKDGSQAYESACRSAYVTEPGEAGNLSLMVANPTGLFFSQGIPFDDGDGSPGDPECLSRVNHGNPFRYCACGWTEPHYQGGTWHHAAHA